MSGIYAEHAEELAELERNVSPPEALDANLEGRDIVFRETHGSGDLREVELVKGWVIHDHGDRLNVNIGWEANPTPETPAASIERTAIREVMP